MKREEITKKIESLNEQAKQVRGLGASAAMYRICAERKRLERMLEK